MRTKFPTVQEALYLHTELLSRFGGREGVLDIGLLESALGRPRSGYYASLSEQAAALMHSLAKNHAFVDGNKRVAFALTAIFLLMNGFNLKVNADDAEDFVLKVAASKIDDISSIANWLEKRIVSVKI